MPEKKELTGIFLILVLASVLRLSGICFDSLWLDEGYQSLVGACGHGAVNLAEPQSAKFLFRFENPASVPEMLANFRTVDPLCPPLYAVLLNRWMAFFGQTDFTLRLLSALISVLSVASSIFITRTLLGSRVALCCGLLQAISPFDIHYAQEARMYSLVALNAVLSGGSLLVILKPALKDSGTSTPVQSENYKPAWLLMPLYVISTWALVNSHYTGLFLAASQGLACVAFLFVRKNWALLGKLAICWLSIALLWLPWIPMFLQSAHSRTASFYVSRTADLIWPFKALLLRIPINWLAFMSGQRVMAYASGVYATSAAMLAGSAFIAFKARPNFPAPIIRALWLWALMPAILLWLIDVLENHRVVEISRYLIYTAPAIYMLAGAGFCYLIDRKRIAVILLAAHLVFAAANLIYTHSVKQKEPWQEMAARVEELVPDNETLVVSQHYDIALLDRYLNKPRLQLGLSPAMGEPVVKSQLEKFDSFALLTAQDGESIAPMVPADFRLTKQVDMSHGLHLRLYER